MSQQDTTAREASQAVQLFQDAHQKMVMLKRVEEQMMQLQVRRRTLMDELRQVQAQINEEFERMFSTADSGEPEAPSRMQSLVGQNARAGGVFRNIPTAAVAPDGDGEAPDDEIVA